jgi:hypothetical protein
MQTYLIFGDSDEDESPPSYCGLMPAALMISPNCSMPSFYRVANSSEVPAMMVKSLPSSLARASGAVIALRI